MGDPLFERRALVRNVHIDSKFLQRNIQASLLAQLRMKIEGVCVAEGYVQQRSITIVEHSLGRTNLIKGGLDYAVQFQADVCMPHPGQVIRVPVVLKSKIGIHAEVTPLKVLLPRDLHIGNAEFDQGKEGDDIEVEVVGARFQQGDTSIVVLGKLRSVVEPDKRAAEAEEEGLGPQIAAPVPGAPDDVVRKVVVDVAAVKPDGGGRARKRLNPSNPTVPANESGAKGAH